MSISLSDDAAALADSERYDANVPSFTLLCWKRSRITSKEALVVRNLSGSPPLSCNNQTQKEVNKL